MKGKKKIKVLSPQKDKKGQNYLISQKADGFLKRRWVSLLFLGGLSFIAFLIRLSFLEYYKAPLTGDSAIYAKIAWGIKNGYGLHWWSVVWSPFYPFMTFLFSSMVGSLETAAQAVSLFWGSLTVVPFFFLTKNILNPPSAYIGSPLIVFFPALVIISVVPLSEATYTFFLLLALLCGWLFISKRSKTFAFLFGICGGVCYLTRPEFLVTFVFVLLVFGMIQMKKKSITMKRTLSLPLICLLGFLILALPYVNYMHSQTGHWILSGKTAHNILKHKAYFKSLDPFQQRKAFAQVLLGLTDDNELKGKVLLGKESLFSFLFAPGFFGYYLWRAKMGLSKIDLFFLIFLLLSLFYIFSWRRDEQGWQKRIFVLCAFVPLVTIPIFFIPTGRLIEPYSPFLILLSIGGISNIGKWMDKLAGNKKSVLNLSFGSLAVVLVVASLLAFSLTKANKMAKNHQKSLQNLKQQSEEFKKLGLWVDQILPSDASVMYLSGEPFFFYCDRVTYPLPFAPYERIVQYAKKNKVDYLLVSLIKETHWQKDLLFLLEPVINRSQVPKDPRLRLVDIYQAPSGLNAVLYKFVFKR